jgi:hypothetical protein
MTTNAATDNGGSTASQPAPTTVSLLHVRTHPLQFSPEEVLINPALVPFAKPGSVLQVIPGNDLKNESAEACDRYLFRLPDFSEKEISTKYGNLQLSIASEAAKAFKLVVGSEVAVSLVRILV